MEPVEIAAGRLQLRPWHTGDTDVVRAALTDPEIARWRAFGAGHAGPAGDGACAAWLATRIGGRQAGDRAAFAVMDATTGEVYGGVELTGIDEDGGRARLAHWLLPAGRGRGFATQSMLAVTRWAFGALGLHRVQYAHDVADAASCAVARRARFAPEGVARGSLRHVDGTFHDEHVHARLATDPQD